MRMFASVDRSASVSKVSAFDDHLVITPRHQLGRAVKMTGSDLDLDLAAIERAEAALAQLAGEFPGWMLAECDRLDACRTRARATALSGQARNELFRAAHDIKGQAATFGYPSAAAAAECLCRLLEGAPNASRIPPALLDQHVDGIRAIIREDVRPDSRQLAAELAGVLNRLVTDFLAAEQPAGNADMADVASPSLAPR